MPDYQKGKIYTIRCHKNDKWIYVGSTIQPLSTRFGGHKRNTKISLYKFINNPENNTSWEDWYIELYELYPCGSKEELCKRENEVLREIATINKKGAYTGLDKKEYKKEYNKEYRAENKDTISAKQKEHYEKNKDTILAKQKEYRVENKDNILAHKKEYYAENRDTLLAKKKEYWAKNRDTLLAKKKEHNKAYYQRKKAEKENGST
jgi:hypothetical protein